jgi:hypothetical protein
MASGGKLEVDLPGQDLLLWDGTVIIRSQKLSPKEHQVGELRHLLEHAGGEAYSGRFAFVIW